MTFQWLRFQCSLVWVGLLLSGTVWAFPNLERPDNPNLKPLSLALDSEADAITVSPDDRWIIVNQSDKVVLIDTASWEIAQDQPEALSASIGGFAFQPDSDDLFAYSSNGFITRILTDDPLADLLEVDVSKDTSTGTGPLVIDPEDANSLFLLNKSSKTLFKYDVAGQEILGSAAINAATPNDIAYISLPTEGGAGSETDKIIVTSSESKIFIFDENLALLSLNGIILAGTHPDCPTKNGNHNLIAVAVSPDRDLAYILDATDLTVHVFDTVSNVEIDADSNAPDLNPICLHQIGPGNIDEDINSSPRRLFAMNINEPADAQRLFIIGDQKITVMDGLSPFEFIDLDSNTDLIDSIALSRKPMLITASSLEDGYIYTANSDGSISVISDNPFVTISAANPDKVTEQAPTFSIEFQSDEVCNGCKYRVRAGGDIRESGKLLLEASFTEADLANTTLSTAGIDVTSDAFKGIFQEGENTIFLFVDDAEGHTGRDSIQVTIDRPPPDVQILNVGFGDQKGYVEISRLSENDIKQYNVYVLEALDQLNPACPGGLDFAAAPLAFSAAQPEGGSRVRIEIPNLTNGVAYCVAIRAEDDGGNLSANFIIANNPIVPEQTAGITELSGETGCGLQQGKSSPSLLTQLAWTFVFLILLICRWRPVFKRLRLAIFFSLLLSFFFSAPLHAVETTDQKWSAQFQGGFFLPTDHEVDQFLGKCCNGMYQFTFGRLWDSKYELNLGVGLMSEGGKAIGVNSGRVSEEKFNFTVVPISNSFIYRVDYVENQLLVPYVGFGFDYMFFRENLQSRVTKGWKFGYHAMAGLQILMEFFDPTADALEAEGINDVYLTLEARWNQIDNFGGKGLDFNGLTFSAGLLFEF